MIASAYAYVGLPQVCTEYELDRQPSGDSPVPPYAILLVCRPGNWQSTVSILDQGSCPLPTLPSGCVAQTLTLAEFMACSIWLKVPRGLNVVREKEYGRSSLVLPPPRISNTVSVRAHPGRLADIKIARVHTNRIVSTLATQQNMTEEPLCSQKYSARRRCRVLLPGQCRL